MAPLKLNSSQGIPGETNFRCKLPKYVNKTSLCTAVFHIRQSYNSLKKDNIDEYDFIAQTLSRILPNLHVDICKHFALTSDLTPDHIYVCNDDSDVSGRHVGTPGATDETRFADAIVDGCDGDKGKQCIWCSKLTGSDNDKALCPDCVAIPDRILSLETRLDERDRLSSNQDTSDKTSNEPQIDKTDQSKDNNGDQSKDTPKNADCHKSPVNPSTLSTLKQNITDLTNKVEDISRKFESLSQDKVNNEVQLRSLTRAINSFVSSAPDPKISSHDNNGDHHSTESHIEDDQATDSVNAKTVCPSAEQQIQDYRNNHRSKQSSKHVILPTAYPTPSRDPQNVDVLIIGDSMTKRIDPSKMSRRLCVQSKSLPGARIEDAFDTVCHLAGDLQPGEIIIHLGTNNIAYDGKEEIIAKLISLADQIAKMTRSKSATLSSIIHRAYETDEESAKVDDINAALKLLANQRSWPFIVNDNIIPGLHLAADGVHLNNYGIRVMARNLITRLRDQSSVTRSSPPSDPLPNQRPRSPNTMRTDPFSNRQDSESSSHAMAAENDNSAFRSRQHRKFRKKPKGRVFPRDWLDCLQTARTLLNRQAQQ